MEVWEEPVIKTSRGIRKPDLVLTKERIAFVLDTIICSDNALLSSVHQQKVDYYNVADVRQWVLKETRTDEVVFGSITISSRGAMSRETTDALHRIGIAAAERELMIVKVLEGNVRTLQQWRRSGYTAHV